MRMSQPQSITEAFLPLLPDIPEPEMPMFIAILERIAAGHYRRWAQTASDPVERAGLEACERREVEIAEFIESLYPESDERIAGLHEQFPDLEARWQEVLDGRTRSEELRIQSEAELGGADLMRQFASAYSGAVAARFISLAHCEEANSQYLAALLDA